jgi:hypothetical protein
MGFTRATKGWVVPAPTPGISKIKRLKKENEELRALVEQLHERVSALEPKE